jgi:hypothetical protein
VLLDVLAVHGEKVDQILEIWMAFKVGGHRRQPSSFVLVTDAAGVQCEQVQSAEASRLPL